MGLNLKSAVLLAEGHGPANHLRGQSATPKTIPTPATATERHEALAGRTEGMVSCGSAEVANVVQGGWPLGRLWCSPEVPR
jgi:hypothetical protein